jgi:hypothetical protein
MYPIDSFPTYWLRMEESIRGKRLLSIDEVLEEIERKDDGLRKWAKEQNGFFFPLTPEIQTEVTEILGAFPKMVDSRQRNMADPFVIALAKVKEMTVVTEERNPGTNKRPTIPYVCEEMNIRRINVLEMLRELKWKF